MWNWVGRGIGSVFIGEKTALEAAQEIRDALGVGDIVKAIEPIDVVDVTVVIGRDLVAATDVVQGSVAPIAERDVEFGPDSGQNEGTALGE